MAYVELVDRPQPEIDEGDDDEAPDGDVYKLAMTPTDALSEGANQEVTLVTFSDGDDDPTWEQARLRHCQWQQALQGSWSWPASS